MHALIIEDEELIALSIEDALRACGCTSFDFATTAADAEASARLRRPGLITADVQLAPGSGLDAVEAICARTPTPVIFITGTPLDVARRFPGSPIVNKPFDARRIREAVELVTGRKH